MSKDYYNILEVDEKATQDNIKSSYRKLAKKYHPDKNKENKEAEEKFKEIAEAYDVLGDVKKRQKYDNSRKDPFERMGFNGFGGKSTGFGFDDFMKGGFGRGNGYQEEQFNIQKLHVKVRTEAALTDLLNEEDISISFKRRLISGEEETKDIRFKINLRKRRYDLRKIASEYVVIIPISGMGDEMKGIRHGLFGNPEEFHAIGDLIVEIKIKSDVKFKIEEGNIIEDISIDLNTVLFSKEKDYIVESLLGKKYKIDINNPKNLSSLKFTVKGNGIVNRSNKLGDYVANLVINTPNLGKLTKKELSTLEELLSK